MKKFVYISEDDGQEHMARRIDWNAVLNHSKAIAMILEEYPYNMHYASMAYVRILDADKSEPYDACIGGDVQSYLNRWHDGAQLVNAPTFMDEWMLRRAWQALQSVPSYVEE